MPKVDLSQREVLPPGYTLDVVGGGRKLLPMSPSIGMLAGERDAVVRTTVASDLKRR